MTTIEEAEIIVKNMFGLVIKKTIQDFNESMLNNPNPLIQNLKIVIGGGEAFNFYFKDNPPVFKTHDFDLRIIYDRFMNELDTRENLDNIERLLIEQKHLFCMLVAARLTEWIEIAAPRLVDILASKNIVLTGAVPFNYIQSNYLLDTVQFEFSINGETDIHINSIMDIIHYTPRNLTHYGLMNHYTQRPPIPGQPLYQEVQRLNAPAVGRRLEEYLNERGNIGNYRRAGYVRNYLHSTNLGNENNNTIIQVNQNLWYISLGFLLWDTVRMLNWYIDELIPIYTTFRTTDPDAFNAPANLRKYDRYVEKYIGILTGFNDLGNRLRCENPQIQELIGNCTNSNPNKTELCVDNIGNSLNNKEDIILTAIRDGILPEGLNQQAIDEIAEINTFEDLCNLVSANTVYNNPENIERIRREILERIERERSGIVGSLGGRVSERERYMNTYYGPPGFEERVRNLRITRDYDSGENNNIENDIENDTDL